MTDVVQAGDSPHKHLPLIDLIVKGLLGFVGTVSLVVLAMGWGLDQRALTNIGYQFAAMVPSTAALLLIGSTALLASRRWQAIQIWSGSIVFGGAILNLAILLSGTANGIDQLIWPQAAIFAQERMSEATSLSFILLGSTMLATRNFRLNSLFATTGLVFSLLALVSVLFDARALSSAALFSTMSVPTAAAFLCLFTAVLLAGRDRNWVEVVLRNGSGSASLRRVLPWVLIFPFALNYLTNLATRANLFDASFQASLISVGTGLMLCVILIRDAHRSNTMKDLHAAATARADAAEKRQLELAMKREKAQLLMEEKSRFLANMSHEIRTPMNGILGFSDLLLREDLAPQHHSKVALIHESGETMLKLLDAILDLSKIEAGQMKIVPTITNTPHLVESCVSLFKAAAAAKGLRLHGSLDPHLPEEIVCDDLRIRQVLSNLIGNAVKFTNAGEVEVRAKFEDGLLLLSVQDTGIGIAPDKLDSVLGEFVQVEEGNQRSHGGSGLGLNISKKLVELMDGSLILESELGHGTTVNVTIPVGRPQRDLRAVPSHGTGLAIANDGLWQRWRIAVAEDHDINQMLIMEMIAELGLQAELFEDGRAAVEGILAAERAGRAFDLVLMDIQMPELDGLSATCELRLKGTSEQELPIIALTANAFESDVQSCLEAGMQDHLAKPLSVERLQAILVRWLLNERGAVQSLAG